MPLKVNGVPVLEEMIGSKQLRQTYRQGYSQALQDMKVEIRRAAEFAGERGCGEHLVALSNIGAMLRAKLGTGAVCDLCKGVGEVGGDGGRAVRRCWLCMGTGS